MSKSKGWYGKSFEHSLASKGIKTKNGTTYFGKKKVYPHSYKASSVQTMVVEFKDGESMVFMIKDWANILHKFTKDNEMEIQDRDGTVRPIELSDIKFMAFANPDPLTEIMEYIYKKKIKQWYGGMQEIMVTEYYPSLKGKTVKLEGHIFSNSEDRILEGTIIEEKPEYTEKWGWNTHYTVIDKNGKTSSFPINDIEEVNGVKPEKLMIVRIEEADEGKVYDEGLAQR